MTRSTCVTADEPETKVGSSQLPACLRKRAPGRPAGNDDCRFGDPSRTNLDQLAARDGLYKALAQAFGSSGIRWRDCVIEDRGDGALILVPPEVPKSLLAARVPAVQLARQAAQVTGGVPGQTARWSSSVLTRR